MAETVPIRTDPPPGPPTIPSSTAAPAAPATTWPAVAGEGVRQVGALAKDGRGAWVATIALYLIVGGLVVAHQMGASTVREQRKLEQQLEDERRRSWELEQERKRAEESTERALQNQAVLNELRNLGFTMEDLIEEVGSHHPGAERVGKQLQRGRKPR